MLHILAGKEKEALLLLCIWHLLIIDQVFQISEISCAGFVLAGIQKDKHCFIHRDLL